MKGATEGSMRLAIILLAGLAIPAQEKRLPFPEPAAQKEAEALIRDVFKEDYAKKSAADKASLAGKMVSQARESKGDTAACFILYREAQDLYAQAGDPDKALETIDELSRLYAADATALKSAALASASKASKAPEELVRLAAAQLRFAGDAMVADQYDAAEKAAQAAAVSARKAGNLGLASRAGAKGKEIAEAKSRYDALKKARETLASNPDDPPANSAVGQFMAIVKGDWPGGVPLLAKGSDASLKAAAEKDLAAPKEAPDQAAAGDAWWDLSERETGAARENLRARALFWYEQSLERLTGLGKVKVEKRMSEVRTEKLGRGSWVDLSDPKFWGREGRPGAPIEVGENDRATLAGLPAGEFDGFSMLVRPLSEDSVPNIHYVPRTRLIVMNTETQQFQEMRFVDNAWKAENKAKLPKKEEYLLTVLLARGETEVYLNGVPMFRFAGGSERLSPFYLSMFKGRAAFSKIRVRKKAP